MAKRLLLAGKCKGVFDWIGIGMSCFERRRYGMTEKGGDVMMGFSSTRL